MTESVLCVRACFASLCLRAEDKIPTPLIDSLISLNARKRAGGWGEVNRSLLTHQSLGLQELTYLPTYLPSECQVSVPAVGYEYSNLVNKIR